LINIIRFYIVGLLLLGAPLDMLVNRQHSLPDWYTPGVRQEAQEALDQMIASFDYPVNVVSDFRSYDSQIEAYLRLVSDFGEKRAEEVIAAPGHSEHQLGTVFDLAWAGLTIESTDPRNMMLWEELEKHAHEFGFIISYPLKEVSEWPYNNRIFPVVTEYRWEPWHLRYVGLEQAELIFDAGYLDPRSKVLPQDFYQVWP
jgi:zinc D-Ala-D-Ala carboxypeptidase